MNLHPDLLAPELENCSLHTNSSSGIAWRKHQPSFPPTVKMLHDSSKF